MKKIYYSLISALAFVVLLGGCNKFNDQFEGLDEMTKPTNLATINYTLTAADYTIIKNAALANATNAADSAAANAIVSSLALNTMYGAAEYAPAILNAMYKAIDIESNTLLTYNYDNGTLHYLADYTNANTYKLVDADYESLGGLVAAIKYFVPSLMPEDGIPDILSAQITDAVEDQLVLVEYHYSDNEPASSGPKPKEHLLENFEEYANYEPVDKNGWKSVIEEGSREWQARTYDENAYAQANSHTSAEENITYLVSPTVDLSGSEDNTLSFDIAVGYWTHDGLSVLISENYDGVNFDVATWIDISSNFTIPSEPTIGYSGLNSAGTFELSAYTGEITIAFRYEGNNFNGATETTTYQIDNILVEGTTYLDSKKSVAADYDVYNVFYQQNGSSWEIASGVYALSASDYDAMGTSSGQPGKYNNFDSSMPRESYLPTLLANLFPYAQEGDMQILVYKYYSGTASLLAAEYILTDGVWISFVEKTEQFIFTQDGWFFDPTVKMTMEASDHQLMVDYILGHSDPAMSVFAHPFYKNEEFYYGFGSRFTNVNFRISYRTPYFTGDFIQPITIDPEFHNLGTVEEKVALMWSRLEEGMGIFLQLRYPDAVPFVNGIEVFYHAEVVVYYVKGAEFGSETHTYIFKCTDAASGGNSPSFEFISESRVD